MLEGISSQDTLSMTCVFSTLNSSLTVFTDSTSVPNVQYYYALVSTNSDDLCSWSNEVLPIFRPDCPDSATAVLSIPSPRGVCFTPSGEVAYVASFEGGINVINTSTFTIIDTIESALYMDELCMLPGGDYLYAVQYDNTDYKSRMIVVSVATNTIVKTFDLGHNSRGLCTVPGKDLVYVCNAGEESIYAINTQTHSVVDTIATGSYNTRALCSLPSGDYLYATRTNSDDIIVISVETNEIVDTIAIG